MNNAVSGGIGRRSGKNPPRKLGSYKQGENSCSLVFSGCTPSSRAVSELKRGLICKSFGKDINQCRVTIRVGRLKCRKGRCLV
jgi:hypothetical protein